MGNPFGGTPEASATTAPTSTPDGIQPPNLAAEILSLPAESVVPMILHIGQGLVVRAAAQRYGEEIARREFALTKEETKSLEAAGAAYMKSLQLERMTPGEMLAVQLVLVFGGKIVHAEGAKAALESRQPKAPPPKPQPATKTA